MLKKNTTQVNLILTRGLAVCALAMLVLLLCNIFGIFEFTHGLIYAVVGSFFAALSPMVLRKCKAPDGFVKYYTLILTSVLIGILGTFTGIGIYITYVLVPVASALYFDRRFTLFFGGFSYLCMTFGVWFNTMNRWETQYLGWGHLETFRAYMIGFTIEYLMVILFVHLFVRRASTLMEEQHETLNLVRAEEEKYRMLSVGLKDVVFEYDPCLKHYKANKSVFADMSDNPVSIEITDVDSAIQELDDRMAGIIHKVDSYLSKNDTISREIDLSYKRNGREIPLWYQMEARVLRDTEGTDYHIVGKLHNITTVKLNAKSRSKDRLSAFFMEGMNLRNSMVRQLMKETAAFTEEDFMQMAQSHQFLAGLSETLKSAVSVEESLQNMVEQIGIYLGVNRIVTMQGIGTENCRIGYQWNSDSTPAFIYDFKLLTKADIEAVTQLYDLYGYLEHNPAHERIIDFEHLSGEFVKCMVTQQLLGNQLWVPTFFDGKYDGAVFFDRYDTTPYLPAEKFFMSEAVNLFSSFLNRVTAENASKAKSVYLSNMSHEIRTPMNAILGMSEVALREKMPESVKKCLKTIRSSSQGLLGIINDILDFSKIESGKVDIIPEEYDTLSLINDVYIIAKARNAEKRLKLTFHIPENLPARLLGDAVRVKQIMVNLVNNAIKYTDSGSVEVFIECEVSSGNTAKLSYRVTDTGQGIRKEDMADLFQNYNQVNKEKNHHKEGTGLGLAISKQLAELMEGRIFVESEFGVGSTFGFELPQIVISRESAGRLEDYNYAGDEVFNMDEYVVPNAKVLIVDDNDINREVACALFEPMCMDIETAVDGGMAVQMTREKKYDLILMDNYMPVLCGGEATKLIRSEEGNINRDTPIVALTADAVSGARDELMACGMNDFISKPIDLPTACRKIKKWIEK